MIRFILQALAAALGFWVASKIVPGVHVTGTTALIEGVNSRANLSPLSL
jgi:uncharacterized membrane protein YvlD (DUF360 family)